jgi:hypothetical protein
MNYTLKEVFTPGGLPSVTYVDREHLDLERKIKRAVSRGYAINVVTGPTKSGKSVLCHRVLGSVNLIAIEGGQVQSEDEFWQLVAHKMQVAATEKSSTSRGSKASVTGSAGWKLGALLTLGSSLEANNTTISEKTLVKSLKIACIDAMINSEAVLLVDDFHYVDPSIQKTIIQAVKGPVMAGLTVFLLAVPHRAFDPITVENEIEGRFKHIEIPPWSVDDLELIPKRGFPALNIDCPNAVQRRICEEAFGNPLLVQEACSELCLENDIDKTQPKSTKIDGSKLDSAFAEIARSKGFPKFEKLKKGPQARKARQPRSLADGTEEDIYSTIMMAIAASGPKAKTSYDDIRASMKDVLAEGAKMPQKNEITSALSHMSAIAKKDIKGEPPLEWVRDDDDLIITDPFLLFYMKYAFRKK